MASNQTTSTTSAPVLASFEGALGYLRWLLPTLLVGYLLSGIIVVGSDEVAVVMRMGQLSGGSAASAQRFPGMHFTMPRPIDEVVRVKVKKVYELEISELHSAGGQAPWPSPTIDPTKEGYVLTGDRNVVQVAMTARYLISDPVAFALFQSEPEATLKSAVMAATVRTMGEVEVDSVLSEGRAEFIVRVVQRAQKRLDRAQAGVDLVSIEVTDLAPPAQVKEDFEQVQAAFIDMQTQVTEAKRVRELEVPKAQATRDQELREAQGYATELLAQARGDVAMWNDLYEEYRQKPQVVRERLYNESIENTLSTVSRLRFVPPPPNGRSNYGEDSFRISVSSGK